MGVKFYWASVQGEEAGTATYIYGNERFDVEMPDFASAWKLNVSMENMYADGVRQGHHDMMRAVSDAMNKAAR